MMLTVCVLYGAVMVVYMLNMFANFDAVNVICDCFNGCVDIVCCYVLMYVAVVVVYVTVLFVTVYERTPYLSILRCLGYLVHSLH